MALVRCPRCKLDTSDALPSCPNCGAGFKGPDRAAVAATAAIPEPTPKPASVTEPAPVTRAAVGARARRGFGPVVATVFLFLLVALFASGRISSFVWFVLLLIWVATRNGLQSVKRLQGETLRAFASRASATRGGRAEKPLELLHRIELEIQKKRDADRTPTGEGP